MDRKGIFFSHSYYVPSWSGLFTLLGLFIVGMAFGAIVMVLLHAFFSEEFYSTYGTLFMYPVQFIPVMLYVASRSRADSMTDYGFRVDNANFGRIGPAWAAIAVTVMTLAAAVVSDLVSLWLPDMPEALEQVLKGMTEGPVWLSLLTVSIMAPLFEEWLCRGVLLRGLLHHTSAFWAILVSSLFFALIHGNPWQAVPAFILGCLFGYVYYRTGSLKLTMLMHCVNNTAAVVMSNIPSVKDLDSLSEMMPTTLYAVLVGVSVAVIVWLCKVFRDIPLGGEKSSCEKLLPLMSQPSGDSL